MQLIWVSYLPIYFWLPVWLCQFVSLLWASAFLALKLGLQWNNLNMLPLGNLLPGWGITWVWLVLWAGPCLGPLEGRAGPCLSLCPKHQQDSTVQSGTWQAASESAEWREEMIPVFSPLQSMLRVKWKHLEKYKIPAHVIFKSIHCVNPGPQGFN